MLHMLSHGVHTMHLTLQTQTPPPPHQPTLHTPKPGHLNAMAVRTLFWPQLSNQTAYQHADNWSRRLITCSNKGNAESTLIPCNICHPPSIRGVVAMEEV